MKKLGIVAGFGPHAATYFINRVLDLSSAKKEWEYFPMIAYYNTQVPSRTRALLYGEKSPKEGIIDTINALGDAGAEVVAVPCNSAHGWYDEVINHIKVPWLNIIEITSNMVKERNIKNTLIIGAYVPTKMKLYDRYLKNTTYLTKNERNILYGLIEKLKLNRPKEDIKKEFYDLLKPYRGEVDGIVIACTEPSMLFKLNEIEWAGFNLVDSTNEYAKKCVEICKRGDRDVSI